MQTLSHTWVFCVAVMLFIIGGAVLAASSFILEKGDSGRREMRLLSIASMIVALCLFKQMHDLGWF